jgi:hypothetical protein
MPHQDKDDLRTPFHELKEILASLAEANLESVSRHGNASLGGLGTATLALLTFGWGRLKTLSVRFDTAQEATKRVCGGIAIAGSYQALMVALRSCGHVLLNRIREHLVLQLQAQSNWLFLGRPTFAVDGSQFAVPRTKSAATLCPELKQVNISTGVSDRPQSLLAAAETTSGPADVKCSILSE